MLEIAKYRYDLADKELYLLLKSKVNTYFGTRGVSKFANSYVVAKVLCLTLLGISAYAIMLFTPLWVVYFFAFLVFLMCSLVIGMTAGHDAAHSCLTGDRKWDRRWFQVIFMANGINPEPWKEKHNKSHHSFPNVHEYDSDMELSNLIYLSKAQKKTRLHRFQHLYAPFLYLFFTLGWIYYFDFVYHFKHHQGNLVMQGSLLQLPKILAIKIIHLFVCLGIPILFGQLGFWPIVIAFLLVHALVSLFLSFTFFMSHHVLEAEYAETSDPNLIQSSWLRHQIDTTVDFHGESHFANFFFGGFHAHTAHHLFPGICHIHYPDLTRIIRNVLDENDLNYRSVKFHEGIVSHLKLLKKHGNS